MFVNGDLKGKFIMDRNLGARDTKRAVDGVGVMYYQFGRKDPFTTDGVTYQNTNAYKGRGADLLITSTSDAGSGVSVFNGVNNPMTHYYSLDTNWCADVDSDTYLWLDFEEDYNDHGKSIFDPSPYGWKVAPNGTWAGFSSSTMTDWDTNTETCGCSYPLADDKFAYYPAHGYKSSGSGNLLHFSNRNMAWTSTPSNTSKSYTFACFNSGVVQVFGDSRSHALNIRPVQHNE